jgi:hypothetical protein
LQKAEAAVLKVHPEAVGALSPYNADFYAANAAESREAASIVLPATLALLERCAYPVRSAVDVGAGVGPWLAVARQHGISDILALEGAWVRDLVTAIPADAYAYSDVSGPLRINRRFDLCLCLEVAEHLPPTGAGQLVDNLVGLSDVILFSAAIPHQGGTHHVNEQWPAYWAALFRARDYVAFDGLRWSIWHDARIPFWYRQNLLVFLSLKRHDVRCALAALPYEIFMPNCPCACVHPSRYEALLEFSRCPPVRSLLRALPRAVHRAFESRLRAALGQIGHRIR